MVTSRSIKLKKPLKELAKSYLAFAEKAEKIWEKTPNGWYSRDIEKEDKERMKRQAYAYYDGTY